MSNPADARRRWFGLFFLFIALGMVIWGQTVLKPHLTGLWYVGYWIVCLGFTGLALLTALLDLWIIRHRLRQEQRDLLRRTWSPLEEDKPHPDEKESDQRRDGRR